MGMGRLPGLSRSRFGFVVRALARQGPYATREAPTTNQSRHLPGLSNVLRRASGLVILLVLWIGLAFLSPRFLTPTNLLTVALQISILAIVAIGQTFTILTAGIDLSVGSIGALAGSIAAGLVVRHGVPALPAMATALLLGMALGGISGLLIVRGNMPPFVATLAMLAVGRGLTLVYTEGYPIAGLPADFTNWGTASLGPIPVPVIVLLVVLAAAHFALRHTRFGLHVYAVGGGEETTRLAGVSTNRVKLVVYAISGFTAALGGVLLTARLWSAQPNAQLGFELDAIAAPVLGGTSLFGGVGSVAGTLIGALIMGTLGNGLNLLEVPSYYQQVVKGLVFILAVAIDLVTKRKR